MGAVDFNWPLIVGGALALGFAGFAGLQLVRLPRVWRGETGIPLPRSNLYLPEVNHRSFPVFVGSIVFVAAGAMLVFVAVLVDARALAVIGLICATIGVGVFAPLWILINATNRPRILVAPSRRGQLGWWAERRTQRQRQASGLPPTEHVVEILEVRPPPDEERPYPPYLVAVCTAEDCDWVSRPAGHDEAHPDPERTVREQASRHSSIITGPHRPLG
jgi:hypothetical protein